jgi:tRNA-specific 2-thiouridylase
MLRRAETLGYDYIATGHYAHIVKDSSTGRYLLKRPADRHKDQTYVLYNLTQYQLERTLFPLADYDKDTVRQIAQDNDLINARKPDSQDICFVPNGKYVEFINKQGVYAPKGNFVDTQGNILGEHQGIINYTIGQRKGLGITFGKPMFVIDKNPIDNTVTLGTNEELLKSELIANDVNLISIEKLTEPLKIMAKTRYNQVEQPATVYPLGDDKIKVVFDEPQRAITKGQAVVMYQGEYVLGGGTIL